MKILTLNYEFPPAGGGGGRLCAAVCEGLAARGHDVQVVTAGWLERAGTEWHGRVIVHRPQTFRRRADTCTVPEMAQYLLLAAPRALQLAVAWKPDVLHAHFVLPTGALAHWLARLTQVPYVLTAHLGDVPGGVPEQTDALFRWLAKPARRIWRHAAARTAVSRHVAGLATRAWGLQAEVIPNGMPAVTPPAIRPVPEPVILWVGRMSVQKDPVLAVRALAELAQRSRMWRARIFGEGPLGPAARAEARRLGLEPRVTFEGWADSERVRQAMGESHILLLTSRSEGQPMVAIEALWHGLAMVAAEAPGLDEVICAGRNGLLAPPEPAALASALQALLQSPGQLAQCRRASLDMASHFEIGRVAEAYERVLAAAASHKSQS